MIRYSFLIVVLLLIATGDSDCRRKAPSQDGAAATYGYTNLVNDLRAAGVEVETAGEVSQPFFSAKGKIIKSNGSDVQVFEYETAAAANAAASEVASDGRSIGRSYPSWIAPPHFYKKGKIIVLYLGDNATVMKVLEAALGKQFAGK